jgi:small nuclear ribonucleoprotein (snRNP)-like protein
VRRSNYLLDTIIRDRVVVTLKDGQSFRGLFNGADRNTLALLDAEYLKPDGPTKVDGEVFIPRDHVAFVQKP